MAIAASALSVLLALLVAFAAQRKLSHAPDVVASYVRVGVQERQLDGLAAILLAGAGGLVAGLFWRPVGIAAVAGLVVYFLLAIGAHVRARDSANLAVPVAIELLALAALVLMVLDA